MKRLAIGLALYLLTNAVPAADLLAVYQRALQNDPQLREAEATRLAALEAKPQALSTLLPQLAGNGKISRERDTGSINETQSLALPVVRSRDTGRRALCSGGYAHDGDRILPVQRQDRHHHSSIHH